MTYTAGYNGSVTSAKPRYSMDPTEKYAEIYDTIDDIGVLKGDDVKYDVIGEDDIKRDRSVENDYTTSGAVKDTEPNLYLSLRTSDAYLAPALMPESVSDVYLTQRPTSDVYLAPQSTSEPGVDDDGMGTAVYNSGSCVTPSSSEPLTTMTTVSNADSLYQTSK